MKDTSWGKIGNWYDEVVKSNDSYQNQVILPNLLRIMEVANKEKILDLACGQGFFAREISKLGAVVTGVDLGKDLIEIARSKQGGIEYLAAPSHKIDALTNNYFDKVCIVLALQNIEKLDATIQEVNRIIKKGGSLYIVLNHPVLRIPGESEWGYDEDRKIQYRRLDGYMSESSRAIDMNPGSSDKSKQITFSFHRPLQVYFKSLRKHGFATTRLEEWISHKVSQKGPREIPENRARKEFPMFLALECKKG